MLCAKKLLILTPPAFGQAAKIAAKIARSLQRQPEMRKRHLPRLNVFSYRVENPRAARQAIFCEQ